MKKISNRKLIFNNATFSNFARIEKLELIFNISQNIYTTREVIEEIKKGIEKRPKLQPIIDYTDKNKIQIEALKCPESIILADLIIRERRLGIGEISAMVLAKELGEIFITDDEKAIKRARLAGIETLDAEDFGFDISIKNKSKATLIFLEILKEQKNISQNEYDEIKETLKKESFIF
jgi:predicted nucleic acid-binding protein